MLKRMTTSTLARVSAGFLASFTMVGVASADVTSTNASAILVYPKVAVNTANSNNPNTPPFATDTLLQLTNTSSSPVNVRCWYVNANGHCSTSPTTICDANGDPATNPCTALSGICIPGWVEHDFSFRLTPKQTIAWEAGAGLADLPLSDRPGPGGQFAEGSIPPTPENPMLGDLKCVQVGDDEFPVATNSLIGQATIGTGLSGVFDQRSYNAIGIQATATNNRDNTLVIGGSAPEYSACPGSLSLDHFFYNAVEPTTDSDSIRTRLVLVPCSEDYNFQTTVTSRIQYLVWNEFEQRFSTSNGMTCYSDLPIVDIDTRPGPAGDSTSIFSVAVQGTLSGQTVIRAVDDKSPNHGNGVLAIAEEFYVGSRTYSTAYVADQRGQRSDSDVMLLPAASPNAP